jgi:hypothetical protein
MHYIGTVSGESASGALNAFGDQSAAFEGSWKLQRSE